MDMNAVRWRVCLHEAGPAVAGQRLLGQCWLLHTLSSAI